MTLCVGLSTHGEQDSHIGFSHWRNLALNRSDLQYLSKALSKPAGDVSCVQSEEEESVFAATPSVYWPWICWQNSSDGGSSVVWTAQKLKPGSVTFRGSCEVCKFVLVSDGTTPCSAMNGCFRINISHNSTLLWRKTQHRPFLQMTKLLETLNYSKIICEQKANLSHIYSRKTTQKAKASQTILSLRYLTPFPLVRDAGFQKSRCNRFKFPFIPCAISALMPLGSPHSLAFYFSSLFSFF